MSGLAFSTSKVEAVQGRSIRGKENFSPCVLLCIASQHVFPNSYAGHLRWLLANKNEIHIWVPWVEKLLEIDTQGSSTPSQFFIICNSIRRHHHHLYRKLNLDSEKKQKKSLWKLIQCNWSSFEVILCRNDDGSRFSRVRLLECAGNFMASFTRSVLFSFILCRFPFFCRPTLFRYRWYHSCTLECCRGFGRERALERVQRNPGTNNIIHFIFSFMAVEESDVIKRQMKKQRQGDENDYRTQRNDGNGWCGALE